MVGELALRYREVVRGLKNQKLRTGIERLANWILQTDSSTGGAGSFTFSYDKRTIASLLGMTPENLSRNLAAVVDRALVLCLPGKPSGAVECLSFVVGAIPHCVEVLQEVPTSC